MSFTPESEKARVVIDYKDVQILNAPAHVKIVFKGEIPRGICYCLKDAGFNKTASGVWQQPFNTDAIFQAQAIINTFYPTDRR